MTKKKYLKVNRKELPKDYFVHVHPAITVVIVVGLFIIVQAVAWWPGLLDYLGSVGSMLHKDYSKEIRTFFLVCLGIHVFEGMVGLVLAGKLEKSR